MDNRLLTLTEMQQGFIESMFDIINSAADAYEKWLGGSDSGMQDLGVALEAYFGEVLTVQTVEEANINDDNVSVSEHNSNIVVTPIDSDIEVSSQETSMKDYLKSEAERLPNGTAAKFLSMSTSVPFDSDTHDFGSERQSNVTKLDFDTSFVTLTINREDAEAWANHVYPFPESIVQAGWNVVDACRAALGKR